MSRTNILHNDVPTEPVARWNPVDGRAVIETPDGKVYSFSLSRHRGQRAKEERIGLNASMWLQPKLAHDCGKPIEIREGEEVGKYPFTALEEHIEFRLRVTDALDYFLVSIDSEIDPRLRKDFARKATHLLREQEVANAVEPALLNNPMPEKFDTSLGPTEGKAGEILTAMIAKWRPKTA